MHERFQAFVHGAILALIIGWVLYIGKPIFVPVVLSVLVVYVIVGLTRLLERIPGLGPALPPWLRYALSIVVIAVVLVAAFYEIVTYTDILRAHAPQYQESLLTAIQRGAAFLGIEDEPTWATLRREVLAQTDMQRLVGFTVASVTSLVATIVFVFICTAFLLLERRYFVAKMGLATESPRDAARIREIVADVNNRIGSYLVLKTFLSILLGGVSWIIMALFGLEFAAFWAVLIGLLNYIPYIGSILGVVFPALMAIVQYGSMDQILALVLLLSIAQFVIGNVIDPYVMGNKLNLSPFAILVSLTVWSALWGVAGAFLAVPITATLTIVLSEFAGTRPIAVLLSKDGHL
jgi:predicted PurR-regulated permease PerM